MTRDNIREYITKVNKLAQEIGEILTVLLEARAWETLGYKTKTEFLEKEFIFTRQYLYKILRAYSVNEFLAEYGYELSANAADELRKFPKDLWAMIARIADENGGLTANNIQVVGERVEEMYNTGGYVSADESIAFNEVIKQDRRESAIRHKRQYVLTTRPLGQETIDEMAALYLTANKPLMVAVWYEDVNDIEHPQYAVRPRVFNDRNMGGAPAMNYAVN